MVTQTAKVGEEIPTETPGRPLEMPIVIAPWGRGPSVTLPERVTPVVTTPESV